MPSTRYLVISRGQWDADLSRETIQDAIEWAKRTPMTAAGFKTEIRRVPTIDEFPQDNEWIKKERAWRESTGQL